MFRFRVLSLLPILLVAACATAPPREPDNLCAIFEEKRDWYKASEAAANRWGAPVHVPMAIMYQESSFRHDARPPMRYFLGFIPLGRPSSAYGYSQAKTASWQDYQRESGNGWADRNDFGDAVDFVQWYIDKSRRVNGVSKWDAYALYLNYHEGWTGYKRRTYANKSWLIDAARRVDARAKRYATQYNSCKKKLEGGWFSNIFS